MNLPLAARGIPDLIGGVTFLAAAIAAQVTDVVPPSTDNWITILLAFIGAGGIGGWAVRAVVTTVLRRGDEDRAADRALLERIMDENAELARSQGAVYAEQLTMLRELLTERHAPSDPA